MPKVVESPGLSKLRAMHAAGNAQGLIDWYNGGADGQIDWGSPGDFEQCVSVASDYLDDPEGFCQLRHIDAVGEPAGRGASANMKSRKGFATGAIPPHETPTDSNSAFDKDSTLAALNPTADNLQGMHAFQDPNGDPNAPSSYKFPHHNVDDSGAPAEANVDAVSQAIDDATSDDSLTGDQQAGVLAHLNAHLADAGVDTEPDEDDTAEDGAAPVIPAAPVKIGATSKAAQHFSEDGATQDLSFTMPIMVVEGAWTGDWRYINPMSLVWRDLPLPVMALTQTTDTHNGAQLVGQLTSIDRSEFSAETINPRTGEPYPAGTMYLSGKGRFTNSQMASEIAGLVSEGFLRGVSVDIGDSMSEVTMVDRNGNPVEREESDDDWDLFDLLFGFSAAGEITDDSIFFGEKILSGRLMGATICPFPAFESAYVVMGDIAMAASGFDPDKNGAGIVYVQSGPRLNAVIAAGGPLKPPTKWFSDPKLAGPTAISILPNGRVFGHLASWTECHIGYSNSCVRAPHSRSQYAYFETGCVLTDDGSEVPTGTITMNTGHAELWEGSDTAKAHYDNTGTVVADVCCGEDGFGIWVAGAIRPDVNELTIRRLRGAALSGDWRQIGGQLELVAALAVNVPGFPIKRPQSRVASGAPMSLVAAGSMTAKDAARLREMLKPHDLEPPKTAVPHDEALATISYVLDQQARRQLRADVHSAVKR